MSEDSFTPTSIAILLEAMHRRGILLGLRVAEAAPLEHDPEHKEEKGSAARLRSEIRRLITRIEGEK